MKIYHYHIPKTGGTYIEHNFHDLIVNQLKLKYNELRNNQYFPHISKEFVEDSEYIAGHFGLDPYEYSDNINAYTTIRNPVDRVVSHFAMARNYWLETPEYSSLGEPIKMFERYLYSDEFMFSKSNFQARFLTNGLDPLQNPIWEDKKFELYKSAQVCKVALNGWEINNQEPTFNNAKRTLDSMFLFGSLDKIDTFTYFLSDWFKEQFAVNYTIPKKEAPNKRQSSKDLRSQLEKKHIDKIIELNAIDYQLWEYANENIS